MQVIPDRLTVARLMAVVAIVAVLLGAGLYWWEHHDVEQAMVTADIQMISQGDAAQREGAAYGLGATRRGDPARIAALLALAVLGDPEPKVRQAAANSLPRVLTHWAAENQPRPTPGVAATGLPPLGAADAEATAVRAVLRALNDPQPKVRHAAAEAWGQIQNSVQLTADLDTESGPALDRLLTRPDADAATRLAAVWDLSRMRTPTLAGRNRVLAVLRADPDPNVHELAVRAIMEGWTPQVDLYPILLARAEAVPPSIDQSIDLWALLDLPPPPPEAIPALLRLLEAGGDRAVVAGVVLSKGGIAARPYLAQIQKVAERTLQAGDRGRLVCLAVQALVAIDAYSPETQALLGPMLRMLRRTAGPWDRGAIKESIATYRDAAAPLVPDLRAMLASRDRKTFELAADLLAEIGAPALGAVPDLEALQRQVHSRAVDAALKHLHQMPDH